MKRGLLIFYLCVLLFSGCLPVISLYSLCDEENIVFEERLLGKWISKDGIEFEFNQPKSLENTYYVRLWKDQNDLGLFEGRLCTIDGGLFLDFEPAVHPCGEKDSDEMEFPYNAFFVIPVRSFAKVEIERDSLKIWLTNQKEFEKLLESEPNVPDYEELDDRVLMTCDTIVLQWFVSKYANDERLFPEDSLIGLVKSDTECDPNDK